MNSNDLQQLYSRELFSGLLKQLFPSTFSANESKIVLQENAKAIKSATLLGACGFEDERMLVIEVEHKGTNDARVSLSGDAFKMMKSLDCVRALVAFRTEQSDQWRLSLMTVDYRLDDKGKITTELSNPRRYSFLLGPEAKIHTPFKQLNKKVNDFDDLLMRFSLEVVNKNFYESIAVLFTELVGGTRKVNRKKQEFPGLLKLPRLLSVTSNQEFAVRLIGRIVFCWFLKEKKSKNGTSLIPDKLLSLSASKNCKNYYETILEKLFFETLNIEIESRDKRYLEDSYKLVPYLNGGLFEPQDGDFYKDTKSIPDSWIIRLLEIFETYNFTIDENTISEVDLSIDPEMLGRIFENLLAEINPETGESARKSTGSFYTPREIVNYMVDESLVEVLAEKTAIEREKINALVTYDKLDDLDFPLSQKQKEQVVNAVAELRILDPACGSGAFPIGILQKISMILQRADPDASMWFERQTKSIPDPLLREAVKEKFKNENLDWVRKLGIIKDVIYGVDIQPIAVEIAKLRCFLTLVVEEKIDDAKPNRGIQPLPNLDFKFVAANSLIQLDEGELNLLQDNELQVKLADIRSKYFNARKVISKTRLKEEYRVLNSIGSISDDNRTKQLRSYDPFTNNLSAEFFDPEYMFGIDSGFDVVIANPPYIGEKGNKLLFDSIKFGSLGKEFYLGKMDIFYFFFHLSLNYLKEGGIATFISTNYFVTASGAKNLINDFQTRATILKLINFNELKVFESALGQHNMISILQKGNTGRPAKTSITSRKGFPKNSNIILIAILSGMDSKTTYHELLQNDLYDDGYIRLTKGSSNPIDKILDKMTIDTIKLESICNINQGIVTGADKVSQRHIDKFRIHAHRGDGIFVLGEAEVQVLNLDSQSRGILKPWFKNSDIYQYSCSVSSTERLIYADKRKYNILSWVIYRDHLEKFREILDAVSANSPYLHRPREINFEGPKIVVPQRSNLNTFGFCEISWYASADVYFITRKDADTDLKFLLGLLNSKLYYHWLYGRGKRKGEALELYQEPLAKIPIPQSVAIDLQNKMIELVEVIIEMKKADQDANITKEQSEIDCLIYSIFNISDDEIKIIEGS